MWLVPKDSDGSKGRVPIPPELAAGLVRWYTGKGSESDHRASVSLVVTARDNHKWIACDCLGDATHPPLLSPAYLSFQETYYLRRLTTRTPHKRRCPFFLPQAPSRIRETARDTLFEIDHPRGLFNAHRLAPEKLAQQPEDDDPDDRTRSVAIPRLGRLLWMLLEAAHTNVIRTLPAEGRPTFSIAREFARVLEAARRFEIAPGICLADHLYTRAIDYEVHRVHARLRASATTWPSAYAPQAFLLLEAKKITGNTIVTGLGEIDIRNRIQHTGIIRAEVEPPFLVLAVVGEHSKREGYQALRAYAQPVFKGNQFIPTEREHDRELLERLTRFQYRMRAKNVQIAVKKPLFDILTKKGTVRPDLIVAFLDYRTGEEGDFAVQLLRSRDSEYLALKQIERQRLDLVRPTLTTTIEAVSSGTVLEQLEAMIG